jgi:hypothetical protein
VNSEVFLADANTFIEPYKAYYPFDLAPSFWVFLKEHIENGDVAVMSKVFDEVAKGTDDLSEWIQGLSFSQVDHRTADVVTVYGQIMSHIQNETSAAGIKLYNERALQEWADNNCADGWLVAVAKAKGHTLITYERPNGSLGTSSSGDPLCRVFYI